MKTSEPRTITLSVEEAVSAFLDHIDGDNEKKELLSYKSIFYKMYHTPWKHNKAINCDYMCKCSCRLYSYSFSYTQNMLQISYLLILMISNYIFKNVQ